MKIKAFFIMILILLAAQFGAAQGDITVHEGATTNHNVTENPGNEYLWDVYTGFSPDVEASATEFEFTTPDNLNEVGVQWKLPGIYYLKVTETDPLGCINVKAQAITVIANIRTIGFTSNSSGACYSQTNGFDLPVEVLNDDGTPLGSSAFPVQVEFTVNGVTHSQQLAYYNQLLEIWDEWIAAQPNLNTTILVEITGATDADGLILNPDGLNAVHSRTIYTNPRLSFVTNDVIITRGLSYTHVVKLVAGEEAGAEYSWLVAPANGTSTDLSVFKGDTATILWDGEAGEYSVAVQVTDGNGCVSPLFAQSIEVVEPGDLVFNASYPNTIICSDLAGDTEGSEPPHSESIFRISYGGNADLLSATITIQNPDGIYIGLDGSELADQLNPEIVITNPATGKDIDFAVADNWENITDTNTTFEIKLINGTTSDELEIQAAGGTDITRTITVRTKTIVEFNFDQDTIPLNTYYSFGATGNPDYSYSWWYVDSAGDTTYFTSTTNKTEDYYWETEGEYELFAQATDENNCLSEIITKPFVVEKTEEEIDTITINAGYDTIIGSCNPYTLEADVPDTAGVTYNWQPGENLDDAASATPVFTPGSTTTFILTVTDSFGNAATDTVVITVSEIVANAGTDITMEAGSTSMLDGTGSAGAGLQYLWTTNNGFINSGENTAIPVVSSFGIYYLTVTDTFGCTATDSAEVSRLTYAPVAKDDYDTTSFQTPVVIPVLVNDFVNDGEIEPGSLMITEPPVNGTAYINYDDYTVTYTPETGFVGNDIFEYTICNTNAQCDNAHVYVVVTDFDFLIPQAFTPNGDGINDYFEIKGIEFYEGNKITIINRWGLKVYEAINYGIDTTPKYWDGKSSKGGDNSNLPTGTYFYVLELGNGQKPIAGSVYIDR